MGRRCNALLTWGNLLLAAASSERNANVSKSYRTLYTFVAFVAFHANVWAKRPGGSSMAAIDVKAIRELLSMSIRRGV
jgi:hypothetical protein